jgi:dTDP-4-amino-4,6-dideoxygalactose transaminase
LAYRDLNTIDYPLTNLIHQEVLSLPISPVMTHEEVTKVIDALNSFSL